MSELDDDAIYKRLDARGILADIHALPEQIEQAWNAGRALELPSAYASCERIVVLGMGGSGIGGLLLQALAADSGAKTPVTIARGYAAPAWVDGRTLVIASSNSGNTEETVSAFQQALRAGARCIAITTGGRLRDIAEASGTPLLSFAWQGQPRSALGWGFASLAAICGRAGLLPDVAPDVPVALAEMRALRDVIARNSPEASNPAKKLARKLHGRLACFIGAGALAPVAYRWRTQVNENAKSWAIADELPEMNHNAHAGYGLPSSALPLLHAVFLRHASMHPRVRLRVDATVDEMARSGVTSEVVDVRGASLLSQMLWAIHLGDFASYYLGLLNLVEPEPVPTLNALKALLASR